jgi:hypothetical protein
MTPKQAPAETAGQTQGGVQTLIWRDPGVERANIDDRATALPSHPRAEDLAHWTVPKGSSLRSAETPRAARPRIETAAPPKFRCMDSGVVHEHIWRRVQLASRSTAARWRMSASNGRSRSRKRPSSIRPRRSRRRQLFTSAGLDHALKSRMNCCGLVSLGCKHSCGKHGGTVTMSEPAWSASFTP